MNKIHRYLNGIIVCVTLISLTYYILYSIPQLGRTEFDDAFMMTRYAKHWLAGEGFSWNSKDGPAYGITSPSYLIIITLVLRMTRCSDGIAVTYTSYVAGLFSLMTLTWAGFLVQKNNYREKLLLPLLVIPYIIFVTPFTYHSLSGMETTLSLFSNALFSCAIVLFVRQRSVFTFLFCLFSGVFAVVTRPDNGLYALFLPPMLLFDYEKAKWRHSLWYFLLFVLAVGCIALMNKFLFNDFLPLSFYAKANGFYKGYLGVYSWNSMQYMLNTLLIWLPCLILIVVTVSDKVSWKVAIILFTSMVTFAYYATVTQIMGFEARYYYPSLAFLLLATHEAVAGHAEIQTNRSFTNASKRRLVMIGVLLLQLVFVLVLTFSKQIISLWNVYITDTPERYYSMTQYRTLSSHQLPSLGWQNSIQAMNELLHFVPQETVMAASEYGWISSQHPNLTIIDLVGLHDRNIAHRGFSATYVMSQEPDLIWFPSPDYTYEVAQLQDNIDFIQDYEYYPRAWDNGIALRKSSIFFTELKSTIENDFSKVYPGFHMSDYLAQPILMSR